jgi:hypothetical protein
MQFVGILLINLETTANRSYKCYNNKVGLLLAAQKEDV